MLMPGDMGRDSKFSRLYLLIYDAIRPFTEVDVVFICKETERDVLLALSQVYRKIKDWTQETELDDDKNYTGFLDSNLLSEGFNILVILLADMIPLLACQSHYVQHLAENIFVATAKFLIVSEQKWSSFLQWLCVCLELAINNAISGSPSSIEGATASTFDSSILDVLKYKVKNANLCTASGIVHVLWKILKNSKKEYDNQLIELYHHSISSSVLKLSHVVMDRIGQDVNSQERKHGSWLPEDASFFKGVSGEVSTLVLLGNLIQLLCSSIDKSSAVETMAVKDGCPVYAPITSLVPKFLDLCFGNPGVCLDFSMTQYLRHKLLMLMLRLSYQTLLDCSSLCSWLQILHDYFEELLRIPIAEFKSGYIKSLEGSPFLSSLANRGICEIHFLHLHRQAILLFLRCCFFLVNLTGKRETIKTCACVMSKSCSILDPKSYQGCRNRMKGFLELHKWIHEHSPNNAFMDCEVYTGNCLSFTSSFLRLYVQEDDLLFKVLLLVSTVPACLEQQFLDETLACQDVNVDLALSLSNYFNPVHLFHLFLAELHYDHQVLLDYLISEDTGSSCAEYLLRCFRFVFNSWRSFVDFSEERELVHQLLSKRRRLYQASRHIIPVKGDPSPSFVKEQHERDSKYIFKQYENTRQPFKKARNCLISLKESVQNLRRKSLFPYNPEVLLTRLTKFQELCFNEDG